MVSRKEKFLGVQVLRGLLFLAILAFHCNAPYANFGWAGVETFFVISAYFLVSGELRRDTTDIKCSFIKRLKRLYPAYLALTAFAVLAAILRGKFPYDAPPHMLFSQNFLWIFTDYSSPMQTMTAHTWTLSIQVWLDLLWLVLLRCFHHTPTFRKVMYAALLTGIAYRAVVISAGADIYVVSLCPIAHMDAYACGSLLAVSPIPKEYHIPTILRGKWGGVRRTTCLRILTGTAGFCGIVGCIAFIARSEGVSLLEEYQRLQSSRNYLNHWFTGNLYLFISMLSVAILGEIVTHDRNRSAGGLSVKNPLVLLGNCSYEMYLFHWPIAVIMKRLVSPSPLVTVPAVFALSCFSVFLFRKCPRLFAGKPSLK